MGFAHRGRLLLRANQHQCRDHHQQYQRPRQHQMTQLMSGDSIPWVSWNEEFLRPWIRTALQDNEGKYAWRRRMERGEVTRFLCVFVVAESFDAEGKAVSNEGQAFGENDRGQIFELTQSVSGSISISCCGSGCERLSFIRKSSGTSTRNDMVINLGNLRSHLTKKGHLQNFTSALKHVPETYTIRNFGLGRTVTGFDFTRVGHFFFLTYHLHNISFVQDGDPETWAAYAEEIRQVVTLYKRSAAHRECANLLVLPYILRAAPVHIPSVSLIVLTVHLDPGDDINSPAINVEKILCDVHDAVRYHADQQFMHLSNGARQPSVTFTSGKVRKAKTYHPHGTLDKAPRSSR